MASYRTSANATSRVSYNASTGIHFGTVLLCGGQSNMALSVGPGHFDADNGTAESLASSAFTGKISLLSSFRMEWQNVYVLVDLLRTAHHFILLASICIISSGGILYSKTAGCDFHNVDLARTLCCPFIYFLLVDVHDCYDVTAAHQQVQRDAPCLFCSVLVHWKSILPNLHG